MLCGGDLLGSFVAVDTDEQTLDSRTERVEGPRGIRKLATTGVGESLPPQILEDADQLVQAFRVRIQKGVQAPAPRSVGVDAVARVDPGVLGRLRSCGLRSS